MNRRLAADDGGGGGGADAFDLLTDVFERHDPLGLVSDDPDIAGEEYAPEVQTLLARLPAAKTEGEARTVVADVLHEWFGPDQAVDEATLDALARDVWDAWRRARG